MPAYYDGLADTWFKQIALFLQPDSVCYPNVKLDGASGRWQKFPLVQRPLSFYSSLAATYSLAIKDLGQLQQHDYTQKVSGRLNYMLEFSSKAIVS